MRDTLDHKELKFSGLAAVYYRMRNERHKFPFDTDYGRGTKRGQAHDYCGKLHFKGIGMMRAKITAIVHNSIVVAVFHIVLSLNFCGSAHHSF